MRINNTTIKTKSRNWVFWSQSKAKCTNVEKIEGFDIVWQDHLNGTVFKQKWVCHHRAEISEHKSKAQLIDEDRYYHVKPEELVFMLSSEHTALHNKYKKTMLGKHHSEESKKKSSLSNRNNPKQKLKPVIEVDVDGNVIREFPSRAEAMRCMEKEKCSFSFNYNYTSWKRPKSGTHILKYKLCSQKL